ncbi:hypothetical protein HDV00_010639 [Rhizophlyctis rosea]|nr:hypothetical protein HDV00_010639 [Rhizophlyctis rosea]
MPVGVHESEQLQQFEQRWLFRDDPMKADSDDLRDDPTDADSDDLGMQHFLERYLGPTELTAPDTPYIDEYDSDFSDDSNHSQPRKKDNLDGPKPISPTRTSRKAPQQPQKTANCLVNTFNIIIIPHFSSIDMSARPNRNINAKTVRKMLNWGHAKFRQRLLDLAEEKDKEVIVLPSEAYTSKTCPRCGTIKHHLGGNELYRCSRAGCGYQADRDVVGAVGMFYRAYGMGELVVEGF